MFSLADFMDDEDRTLARAVDPQAANEDRPARRVPTAPTESPVPSEPPPSYMTYTSRPSGCDFLKRSEAGSHIPFGGRF